MLCPICDTDCGINTICKCCGYEQVGRKINNPLEAKLWDELVIKPRRQEFLDKLKKKHEEFNMPKPITFRNVERKLCIIVSKKIALLYAPHIEANAVLCYGYVDTEAGLTYQTLASINYYNGDYSNVNCNTLMSLKIRADSTDDAEIIPIRDPLLEDQFADIISSIEPYYENTNILACRSINELDKFRNEFFPDDILVSVFKDGQRPEGIWARCVRFLDRNSDMILFEATLLNEPFGDFGVHCGDSIKCVVASIPNGEKVCICSIDC